MPFADTVPIESLQRSERQYRRSGKSDSRKRQLLNKVKKEGW